MTEKQKIVSLLAQEDFFISVSDKMSGAHHKLLQHIQARIKHKNLTREEILKLRVKYNKEYELTMNAMREGYKHLL